MKITVKTTQQKIFQLDVEPSDTIQALKKKIEETQNYPAATQKVIYAGKILSDDKTIESCGVKEKDFFVLMVSKPKPTPGPAPIKPETTAQTSQPSNETPAAAPAPAAPASTAAQPAAAAQEGTTTATPTSAPVAAFGDRSSFVTGEALQTTIQSMVEMGFERDQVLRALRASFNNPDRAVEYLMSGIPAHLEAEAAGGAAASRSPAQNLPTANPAPVPEAAPAPALASGTTNPTSSGPQNLFQLAQQQQQQQTAGTPGSGPGPRLDFSALQNNPQLQQLRELVAQNPAVVQPLLQQISANNPALAQVLADNPEALLQLLGGDHGAMEEGADADIPPGAQVISVTPEERAAIERLEALGFPRHAVLEAYFACDKNEELAANYLFEGSFDD